MSSAVLYLAIVAVWGVVLVPMWLRRDGEGFRLLSRRGEQLEDLPEEDIAGFQELALGTPGGSAFVAGSSSGSSSDSGSGSASASPVARRRRLTRGAVIARRRRRTLGLSLLTVTAIALTATQVAPWWFTVPPALLLAGHLSLLRVAVRMDAARREEARRAAAIRARREREATERRAAEAAEAARTAEVIELPGLPQEEVYDQYTDLRAVGD